jgi:hypothetical protein
VFARGHELVKERDAVSVGEPVVNRDRVEIGA